MTSPPRRNATDAEAKALASPLRMRILRVCLHEPHTNKEIASRLGKDPATMLHHVRTLVDQGFLEAQEPRRGTRGSREIPYRATGKSWTLSNPGASRTMVDTFLDEVALLPAEELDVIRLGVRMTDELRAEFDQRMIDLVNEFRLRAEAAGQGPAWSVFIATHPDPNRPGTTGA